MAFIYRSEIRRIFMKVLIIGATGLLGSEAAKELIKRGHEVIGMGLPPVPKGAVLPDEMQLILKDCMSLDIEELREIMTGCDGFVFAAGVDERIEGPAPIYDMFYKHNIAPLQKLLPLAKECGITQAVVCGSYFTYFERTMPEWELYKHHPYIRSRVDQARIALEYADDEFAVSVLELPYIFGAQPGRKPVWTFLVQMLQGMPKNATLYPKGGTAMITTRQVGQCIAGALEVGKGGQMIPVATYNMTWKEMLAIFHKYMGVPDKKIITLPTFLFKANAKKSAKQRVGSTNEAGLDMVKFVKVMTSEAFMSDFNAKTVFRVDYDDIDASIGESVKLCLDILQSKEEYVDMKA